MRKFIFLFSLFLTGQSQAQEASPWEQRLNVDWLNGGYIKKLGESSFNPGNRIFETEHFGLRSDLNLDYRLSYNSIQKIIVRPRVLSEYKNVEFSNPESQKTKTNDKIDLTESFVEVWPLEDLSLVVGLQNYQWGPAELMNPSDPLWHFNRQQRSLLWREKGQYLTRVNWSPTQTLSIVGIWQPLNNYEPAFVSDRDYHTKILGKAELRSAREAQNYLGASFGSEEEQRSFVGAYGNYVLHEGLSSYADFRFTQGAFSYRPQRTSPLFFDMREDQSFSHDAWTHLGIYGLRFEHEKWDARIEYVYNQRGFEKEDFRNGLLSATPQNPNASQNSNRLSAPGLELYGKQYLYGSVRIPDVGSREQWQFAVRYLHSLMDNSGVITGSTELTLNDQFLAISEAHANLGDKDCELTLQERYFIFLGLRTVL